VHEKLKIWECQVCSAKFGRPGHLKRHIKTVHDNVKPFD
jgi:ribosomal protein L37AE/L43A